MTASTPRRSRSACHSGTGSAPAYRTARAASVSSSEPGNVTTPIRTTAAYPAAPQLSETAASRPAECAFDLLYPGQKRIWQVAPAPSGRQRGALNTTAGVGVNPRGGG